MYPYGIVINLKSFEKFIASNSSKYPTECNSLRTMIAKAKEIDEEFLKPSREKLEEVIWKFFYKKSKMVPHFVYGEGSSSTTWEICDSCSSELETQAKPYLFDEIEMERVRNKWEEKVVKSSSGLDLFSSKLSEDERKQYDEESRKIFQEFFENKEKELNNKILAERERERANLARMPRIPIELLESLVVV